MDVSPSATEPLFGVDLTGERPNDAEQTFAFVDQHRDVLPISRLATE